MDLPPALQTIVDELAAAHPEGMSLDELADALATKPVSYAETELIIEALEEAGISLERPEPPATTDDLARTLAAARALAAEGGGQPSVEEIAARAGLGAAAVRRALQLGRGPKP